MEFSFEFVPVIDATRVAMGMKVEANGIVIDGVGLRVIGIVRVGIGL